MLVSTPGMGVDLTGRDVLGLPQARAPSTG